MALDDYSGLIQSGMNLVPDLNKQLAEQAQIAAYSAQAQNQRAEAQATAAKLSRAQQFQQDIHSFDGSPSAVSRLIMQYPEFADHLKQGWDVQDKAKKESDLLNMGEIYSAASGGNWKLAQEIAHKRADAEKAAGFTDPAYDETLKVMDAAADGDPTQRKVVLNMLGTSIAAVTGPEHFASVYGGLTKGQEGFTLSQGQQRFDSSGHVIAAVAPEQDYLVIPEGGKAIPKPLVGGDGGIVATGPAPTNAYDAAVAMGMDPKLLDPRLKTISTGGGDPASPGAAQTTAPGGFDHAVEHVLSNEGGYNPSDMNGAPVNFGINQKANPGVDVKNLTRDQAKQIYHDKYWVPSGAENLPANLQAPYFDVYIRNPAFAKKALADSGGDPAKFMAASSAYFEKLAKKPSGQPYAQAWATRDAKNTAIATGGASASTDPAGTLYGAPKAKPARMTAQEVAAEGLDPNVVYYRDANGVPQAVSGQSTKDNPLKPWPAAPLTARASNQAAITNIDNALSLLNPNNNSKAAQTARKSIGIGTGMLGDQFTQYNDPQGADFRALLGQIGGVVIKDISGAAVTAAEDERLKKWVPRVTDRPEVAAAKLRNMRREISQRNEAFDTAYSPDQGYKAFQGAQGAPVRVRSIQEARKLAPGTLFITPDGRTLRKK